ncbi:hypothetical protein [Reyranella sp. CPCC 100927]|uniref:hypothetical protein n=1 Tax=Reyranella sp. CPCC 100927 TaxID=2599616 RepID=UPI0011B7DF4A|nr:hypothetical protein [Reyranella sp. CPCC 100927]TWT06062.1 hypothetical protein FQU96_23720 [Reyranella sp. CPCC 100927]
MALMLASVFVGFLWAIGLLAVFGRLVAWRWPQKKDDNKKKGKPSAGQRVSPGAFLAAAGASIVGSLLVANVALDFVAVVINARANQPMFVPFVVGAVGALVLRRDRLPPVMYAVGVAVREFLAERAKAQDQAAARQDPTPIERRFREPVSTVIDAPVTPIIRTMPSVPPSRPDLPPVMVVSVTPRRGEPTLSQRRREIVGHLKARSADLAAKVPAPAIVPDIEPTAAALASQAAATVAETRAMHDVWRAEAEALREQWRKDGEALRDQWRRDTRVKVEDAKQ